MHRHGAAAGRVHALPAVVGHGSMYPQRAGGREQAYLGILSVVESSLASWVRLHTRRLFLTITITTCTSSIHLFRRGISCSSSAPKTIETLYKFCHCSPSPPSPVSIIAPPPGHRTQGPTPTQPAPQFKVALHVSARPVGVAPRSLPSLPPWFNRVFFSFLFLYLLWSTIVSSWPSLRICWHIAVASVAVQSYPGIVVRNR